jgi:hypothetical protein
VNIGANASNTLNASSGRLNIAYHFQAIIRSAIVLPMTPFLLAAGSKMAKVELKRMHVLAG